MEGDNVLDVDSLDVHVSIPRHNKTYEGYST